MTNVNVTDLRRNLPAYLEKVRRGQRIRVTVRGTAVAELIPPVPTRSEADAARALLKGSVRRYERPFDPAIDVADWDANR
jgi:prevent-host-death family protein